MAKQTARGTRKAPTTIDVIQNAGDAIINMLENEGVTERDFCGVVKNPALSMPRNAITQRPYTGLNFLLGLIAMNSKRTRDGRFCTVAQAREHAGKHVTPAKGSQATRLMRPVKIRPADDKRNTRHPEADPQRASAWAAGKPVAVDPEEDDEEEKQYGTMSFKPFAVFHVSEMPDFEPPALEANPELTSHEVVWHFVKAAGAVIESGFSPAFIPNAHRSDGGVISLPLVSDYATPDDWAADCLHEFYHWTGVHQRQGRFPEKYGSGTTDDVEAMHHDYAIEEVRSEFFASVAGRMLNLKYDMRNHAAYLDHWGKRVTDKTAAASRAKAIRSTFNDVAPIAEALQQFMTGEQPTLEWFPPRHAWPRATQAYFDALHQTDAEPTPSLPEEVHEYGQPLPAALAATTEGSAPPPRLPQNNQMQTRRHQSPWAKVTTVAHPAITM